ncbi:MAG: GtrA family protein [Gammaproteobacteria bacterium]
MISIRNTRKVRFLIVGSINTLFGISVYWLLLYSGFNYRWATLFSLVLGVIFSFNSHRLAVFKTDGCFVRYVIVWLLIYFLNIALISVIRNHTGDYLAGIALMPLNVIVSFVLMKHFVFRLAKGVAV